MAFHPQELWKRYQQSPGSAAKLLQANQLKHHSLEDRSEQSSTVWIFFFPRMKRALEQIHFSPTKRAIGPCRESQPQGIRSTHGAATGGLRGGCCLPSQARPLAAS